MNHRIGLTVLIFAFGMALSSQAEPTPIERLEREVRELTAEIEATETSKKTSINQQRKFEVVSFLKGLSRDIELDESGYVGPITPVETPIQIEENVAQHLARADGHTMVLFSYRFLVTYIARSGKLHAASILIHATPMSPTISVIRMAEPTRIPTLTTHPKQPPFFIEVAQDFIARVGFASEHIRLMSASQAAEVLPQTIAQIFVGQIDKASKFKPLVKKLRQAGNVGVFSMLKQPTFLVRDKSERLVGLVKGHFVPQDRTRLVVNIDRFLPIEALRKNQDDPVATPTKPKSVSSVSPQSQPIIPSTQPTSLAPPILALHEWLRPIKNAVFQIMTDQTALSRAGPFSLNISPGMLNQIGSIHGDTIEVAGLVGTLIFQSGGRFTDQTTFAVNIAPKPIGGSIIGLKKHSVSMPSVLSGTYDMTSLDGPLEAIKTSFTQWLNAIKTHGNEAAPLVSERIVAGWFPPHEKRQEMERMKLSQGQLDDFIDYIIASDYTAVHIKLQRLSFIVRDSANKAMGFITLGLTLHSPSTMSVEVLKIELKSSR